MRFVVDTCGWIEWLTDGVLADEFAPYLSDLHNLIVPTSISEEWLSKSEVLPKLGPQKHFLLISVALVAILSPN